MLVFIINFGGRGKVTYKYERKRNRVVRGPTLIIYLFKWPELISEKPARMTPESGLT